MIHTVLLAFVDIVTLCLKLWAVIIIFAHVRKLAILPLRKKIQKGITKTELDELRKQ